jgi:hypothetical protein
MANGVRLNGVGEGLGELRQRRMYSAVALAVCEGEEGEEEEGMVMLASGCRKPLPVPTARQMS